MFGFEEIINADDNDDDDFIKEDARAFGRKNVGALASPYILPYLYNRQYLDTQYGIRKVGDSFNIGYSTVLVNTDGDITIKGKNLGGRPDCGRYWRGKVWIEEKFRQTI